MKHNTKSRVWCDGSFIAFFLLFVVCALAACNKPAAPQQEQSKRYHLTGKIVSLHSSDNSLEIDGDEIPGFMAAMTMSYSVHSAQSLANLAPGDQITADVVVPASGAAYVENIVVKKKGAGGQPPPTGAQHQPQPGEKVPDFALTDQDGKRIHLSSFRGSALLVTFIYTQCPFQEYCPLVSRNFARIYAAALQNPALGSKIHLLSVSFDPEHDTPAVLKQYGQTFQSTPGRNPFDRWQFTVVPAKELPVVANFFGLYFSNTDGQIVHSMSTTVISPDGVVYKWYGNNDWKPSDLLADATAVLQRPGEVRATAQAINGTPKDSVAVRAN